MKLRDITNKFFATFPVIGCHMGIEAELLLSGKKPMGWMNAEKNLTALPPDFDQLNPDDQKQLKDQLALDQAVREGKLIARDVIVYHTNPAGESISRHYAQLWNKENLDRTVACHQKAFNRQPLKKHEDVDDGKMLGYRGRDRWLWKTMGHVPKPVARAVIFVNRNVTLPAYKADAVRIAQKTIAKNKNPKI